MKSELTNLARAYADRLLSKLDAQEGAAIHAKSLDSTSAGVAAQAALREGAADDGYAEANLWTGVGRARSGCGAAIVGDPDEILTKLAMCREMGIEAFILSGIRTLRTPISSRDMSCHVSITPPLG